MGERRGTKALELWCRRITEGYPGVNVQNMTTSWRDGLAFCAMIHHFRPDLIDFNSLNKDDVYGNNELAFRTAEQHLGIPALLDAEDMASCSVPDRLSILTYLSQFYQTFGGSSPSRLAMNRTTETSDERIAPVPESPKQKVGSRLGLRRDPCAACGLPVFLAEKLMIARTLYHRTCFRCARCNNQLTPGNYYETEEGQYCCETCPDEESTSPTMHQKYNEAVVARHEPKRIADEEVTSSSHQRSLSDEEKTDRQQAYEHGDACAPARRVGLQDTSVPDLIAQTSQMRLNFMTNHLLSEKGEELPILEHGLEVEDGSGSSERVLREGSERGTGNRMAAAFPDDEDQEDEEEEEGFSSSTGSSTESTSEKKAQVEGAGGDFEEDVVHSALDDRVDSKEDEEQRVTAISFHDVVKDKSVSLVSREDDTKEVLGKADERGDAERCLSLVQKRLRMFEAQDKKDHVERMVKGHVKTSVETSESKARSEELSKVETKHHTDIPKTPLGSPKSPKTDSKAEVANTPKVVDLPEKKTKIDRISPETEDTTKIDRPDVTEENVPRIDDAVSVSDEKRKKKSDDASTTSDRPSSLSLERCKDTAPVDASVDEGHSKEGGAVDSMNETSLTTAEGIDLSANTEEYPDDLNPFKSDEEDDDITEKFQTAMDSSKSSKVSTNPFESEDEEDEDRDIMPPTPAARSNVSNSKAKQQAAGVATKRLLAAPQISLNPFWSDDEDDHDSDFEYKERTPGNLPVPKPRTMKHTPELGVTHRKSDLNRGGLYASNSSIASLESATTPGGTYRKKKHAPPPPTAKELFPSDQRTSPMLKSYANSPGYQGISPRTTPRTRKTKPAPPPPIPTSTPYNLTVGAPLNFGESPIPETRDVSDDRNIHMWEDQKTNKDEANRNRQSLTNISTGENLGYKSYPDKSVQGKWKRKKGPAPPRPIPHRRKIKVMSLKDVKLELDEIELQQQGLERQGVRLEQLIRDRCESGVKTHDSSLSIDVEELVLELFALVNEKNELFRRQAELMLLRRQQRLEEEHAEVEYQIRCLMSQPEATKTDFDKQREEALIQRLVEIVERRNEIVECLEMDRRREVEEDRSIHKHMGLFAARNKNEISGYNNDSSHSSKTKKGKSKEKGKEKKSKKMSKKDADKDVDETEVKLKRHNKRKWF